MIFKTEDGYTVRVFCSAYVDYGIEVLDPNGQEVFYNPSYLSLESYGYHYEDEDGNPLDDGIPWSEDEWREPAIRLAEEIIECQAVTLALANLYG